METKNLYVAGGCFWGLEDLIREQMGVIDTEVGYTGGDNDNPNYQDHPGHAEAVKIVYDPTKTDVRHLLDFFFRAHDPTTLNQQGNDRGTSYRSAIFFQDATEKAEAEAMIELVNQSGRWENPVVTTLEPFTTFWPAEDYHQDYLLKNPGGYTCHIVRFESYLE